MRRSSVIALALAALAASCADVIRVDGDGYGLGEGDGERDASAESGGKGGGTGDASSDAAGTGGGKTDGSADSGGSGGAAGDASGETGGQAGGAGDASVDAPGPYTPPGNSAIMSEADACAAIMSELEQRASALGCSISFDTCPSYLRKQIATPECRDWDQGSIQASVAWVANYSSCGDFAARPFAPTALASNTSCFPDGGASDAAVSCWSSTTCPRATSIGHVSGDTGSQVVGTSGDTSAWYSVRVTEDNPGVLPIPLRATIELDSPTGTNFDLYVYVDTASDASACGGTPKSSTIATATDKVSLQWGETGTLSNGSDDSRTVSIEVRWVSGTCSAASPYSLTVTGDYRTDVEP